MHLLEEATHQFRCTSSILKVANMKLELPSHQRVSLTCACGPIHPVVKPKNGALVTLILQVQ